MYHYAEFHLLFVNTLYVVYCVVVNVVEFPFVVNTLVLREENGQPQICPLE